MASDAPSPTPPLKARYFDGQRSRPWRVEIWFEGQQIHIQGAEGLLRSVDAQRVQWPERTRHGPRIALLPEGGSLQSDDAAEWDAWCRSAGLRESVVVRWQQSWRAVGVGCSLLLVLGTAGYLWGLPWLARGVAGVLPDSVEQQVGQVTLGQLDRFVAPSRLTPEQQRTIEQRWERVLQAHVTAQAARGVVVRPTRLLIRSSRIGPNALALPGGVMVLTDDMVRLVQNDSQVLAGVLAHELGHVQHRHGLRALVQVGVLGAAASVVWGDYSGVLATVPLWLGQAHYSREAEREADAHSVTVLRDAGVSPRVMVTLFERFDLFRRCGPVALEARSPDLRPSACAAGGPAGAAAAQDPVWGLGFASHPADRERIAFFEAAAR